jgi:hypothetical protein
MTAALLLAAALSAAAAPPPEPFPAARSDARVELLGAVRLLARDERGSAGFYRRDRPYERELELRLRPLADHPVVSRWLELERAGLGYVAAYQWALTLGDPPGLAARGPFSGDAARAAGGAEGLEEFRLMLADFARAADFEALYARTAPLREPMVDDVRAQARSGALREDLERYWGGPVGVRYSLVVSEFVEPAVAVTALTLDPDGTPRLTSLTGAEEFEKRVRPRLDARRGTLWAEALNEALKPAFAARAARLKSSAALFAATSGRCAASWEECARKEAAFAAATRLLALAGDKASADEWPVKYARVGMPHLAPLVERLKEYEASPRRGRTLADFVPRLLDVFDALASSGPAAPPFSLGIKAALADAAPCVLVLPARRGPELNAALAVFRRDKRLCDEELTGEEALARGLAGRAVVAVGSAGENAWLARRWGDLRLPARLDDGVLRLDPRPGEARGTSYGGEIGFVSVARNPDDAARPVLLFTAAESSRVPALLAGFPESADYEIRDGTASVKSGQYEKSRLPWRTK